MINEDLIKKHPIDCYNLFKTLLDYGDLNKLNDFGFNEENFSNLTKVLLNSDKNLILNHDLNIENLIIFLDFLKQSTCDDFLYFINSCTAKDLLYFSDKFYKTNNEIIKDGNLYLKCKKMFFNINTLKNFAKVYNDLDDENKNRLIEINIEDEDLCNFGYCLPKDVVGNFLAKQFSVKNRNGYFKLLKSCLQGNFGVKSKNDCLNFLNENKTKIIEAINHSNYIQNCFFNFCISSFPIKDSQVIDLLNNLLDDKKFNITQYKEDKIIGVRKITSMRYMFGHSHASFFETGSKNEEFITLKDFLIISAKNLNEKSPDSFSNIISNYYLNDRDLKRINFLIELEDLTKKFKSTLDCCVGVGSKAEILDKLNPLLEKLDLGCEISECNSIRPKLKL